MRWKRKTLEEFVEQYDRIFNKIEQREIYDKTPTPTRRARRLKNAYRAFYVFGNIIYKKDFRQ